MRKTQSSINSGTREKRKLTSFTATPAIPRELSSSHHILCVLCAFSKHCPSFAALVYIRTVTVMCHDLVERVHVDPLGRRPFLSLDHRTASVKAKWIWDCVMVEVEEQESISFLRFHYVTLPLKSKKDVSFYRKRGTFIMI